ncbi:MULTISPECIES: biotin--[acetyl-CoA-carboxylase] ligase [unclassified Streptomyces]|uniref:biotin--[acetyl-CoA-carboxylase] ligase n=1 Tax=unclassified Streptomyces TaxID=2593676 RepID=UPI000F6D70D7|nr:MULTISPECIES: biotin--[acetyl-CoA-carboxylase] ligase [unclassified Streptomyces]AZM60363.1 biotin--[acetyl-CoA-carboxylase] ligase [Streptomyces sp. WAC 01438]RSM92714.1 biotin--[acetyl-CoA-carboxylase] ligase [Streptomyces sp. WAC 01420]
MTPRDDSESARSARSRWSDLDRPPLNASVLRRGLVREGALWRQVEVVERTGSTNSDLVDRVDRMDREGREDRTGRGAGGRLEEGVVLVAEEQSAARGRLDRRWTAPARSGLFFSVLLRPAEVPVARWGWLPLLTGVAVATGLSRAAGVDTALKWPNDLLVTVGGEERKAGGILAERAGADGVVIGVGINVSLRADELPVPTAGSLALAGAVSTDRDPLLRAVLRALEEWYGRWRAAGGDAGACGLQETYAAGCATLGREVRAELPGGRAVVGEAVAVDGDGRLVLATGAGVQEPVGAGDIIHLRPARGSA